MSTANDYHTKPDGVFVTMVRRCAGNVIAAFAKLVRPVKHHPRQPWLPAPKHLAIAAACVLAVLLLGMFLIDAAAINAVAHLPRWLVSASNWFTDFGKSGWVLWPLGILFLGLAALPRNLTRASQLVLAALMVRVGFLFVAIAAPGLFVTILKRILGRARPMVTGIADPYVFDPFKWSAAYASLPSGHATTAFTVLAAFGALWPRARAVLLIYALLIAASRIVVTAHYPTDVAAGALVGLIGVWLVRRYFALRGLGFAWGPDGVIRPYPNPSPRRIKSVARELLA